MSTTSTPAGRRRLWRPVVGLAAGLAIAVGLSAPAIATEHESAPPSKAVNAKKPPPPKKPVTPPLEYPRACQIVGVPGSQPIAQPDPAAETGDQYAIEPPLPAGLALDAATGEVSGTATAAQEEATHTVSRTSALGTATAGFTLVTVQSDPVIANVTNIPRIVTQPGTPISEVIAVVADANEWTWSAQLPQGLSYDEATQTISGLAVMPEPPRGPVQRGTITATRSRSLDPNTENPDPDCLVQEEQTITIEVVVKPEPPPATCRIADKAIWVPKTAVQNSGQQMYTNNRTAINAIRRMNALRAWVNGKLTLGDICRHSLTAIDLAPAIPVENRELNRPASPQSSGRPVTFSRDTSSSQGRLPLGQPQFEAVERRLRTAEERFVTLRNRLMQGVVGRDFAAAHPAQVILDQKLFASPSPRPTNPGRPTPPTPPGARAPWLLCSRGGTAATVFADLKCHQRRAARITHLSNVTRRTLLNRIHGELGSFSRVESTSPELVQVGLARLRQGSSPGAADPDARSACPSDDDLKSQLCKDTNNGTDSPAARSAVRRHLQGVYKDENDYMGAAVKYFGVLDRSLGSVHITPNAN